MGQNILHAKDTRKKPPEKPDDINNDNHNHIYRPEIAHTHSFICNDRIQRLDFNECNSRLYRSSSPHGTVYFFNSFCNPKFPSSQTLVRLEHRLPEIASKARLLLEVASRTR